MFETSAESLGNYISPHLVSVFHVLTKRGEFPHEGIHKELLMDKIFPMSGIALQQK